MGGEDESRTASSRRITHEKEEPAKKQKGCFRRNALLFATIFGVALGVSVGFGLRGVLTDKDDIALLAFPGEILMNMFKMIVVPLVIVSLVVGLGNINPKQMGRLGGLAMGYYVVTTFVAVIIGIIMVVSIHPGDPSLRAGDVEMAENIAKYQHLNMVDTILDLFRNFFTDNLFRSTMHSVRTVYHFENRTKHRNATGGTNGNGSLADDFETIKTKEIEQYEGMNILGLIMISVTFGVILGRKGEEGKPLLNVLNAVDKCITSVVMLIIWYSPFGIVFLIAEKILLIGDLTAVAKMLGMYIVTVLSGLVAHTILLLVFYFIMTRKNPLKLIAGYAQAMLTAFGTSSSTAALPVSFTCLEGNMGISHEICQLVLPVGATLNMNGTALYEAVASIFIAQMNGANLGFGEICIVSLTATLATVGAAAIPSAGLVTMILVLTAINMPIKDISLIISIDWMLDRCRTVVNCFGDAVGCCVLQHIYDKTGNTNDEEELSGREVEKLENKAKAQKSDTKTSKDTTSRDSSEKRSRTRKSKRSQSTSREPTAIKIEGKKQKSRSTSGDAVDR